MTGVEHQYSHAGVAFNPPLYFADLLVGVAILVDCAFTVFTIFFMMPFKVAFDAAAGLPA
ncbi:MAG: hypothetical protein WAU04_11570 [Candidatus Nitrotoga sp.]